MRYLATSLNLFLASLFLPLCIHAQSKVLILGVDGVRTDALQAANTPHLDSLLTTSVYSYDALTEAPTWSGVGWSGMLTGVWRNKHGVTDNTFIGANFFNYPHFLQRVEAYDPSLHTVSISHWSPINIFIVNLTPVDVVSSPSSDSLVADEAIAALTNSDPDVIFLHFDDVDHNGHGYGFSPNIPEYISSIEGVDRHVGRVLDALTSRPNFANEDWLILGSTDHGGLQLNHGGATLVERNIFYFASRPGQAPQQLSKTMVLTNSNCMPDSMGLRMSGASDYASVPNDTSFQFGANEDFTLELRLKTAGWSGDPAFLGNKNWNSGANAGFVISCPFGNTTDWKVNIGDGSNRVDVNGGLIADNQWHHLAASCDRNGLLTIYKDGLEEGAAAMSGVGNIDNSLSLGIGQDGSLTYGSAMEGLISEVRVWRTVVDSATLAAWQCMPLDNSHPNYGDLVGYWRMNEGSGLTLVDSGPYGMNGTYAGSASDWEQVNVPDTTFDYSNTPRIVDVATTALAHMCVPIDPLWGLDGNVVGANVPSPMIGGNAITCELQHDYYTVTSSSNAPLSWSVNNGLIVQGADSTTVEVQWGGAGPGQLILEQCNVRDTFDVQINVCSGLQDLTGPDFQLYPNPAGASVKLELSESPLEGTFVRIFDLAGGLLMEESVVETEMQLDLSGLASGMYLVELEGANGRAVKKLQVN